MENVMDAIKDEECTNFPKRSWSLKHLFVVWLGLMQILHIGRVLESLEKSECVNDFLFLILPLLLEFWGFQVDWELYWRKSCKF